MSRSPQTMRAINLRTVLEVLLCLLSISTVYVSTYSTAAVITAASPISTLNPVATSVSINCGIYNLTIYVSTKCTAAVRGSNPGGTVYLNSTGVGNVSLSGDCVHASSIVSCCALSAASCSVTVIGEYPGPVVVTADYSGDSNNAASEGSVSLTVYGTAKWDVVWGSPQVEVFGYSNASLTPVIGTPYYLNWTVTWPQRALAFLNATIPISVIPHVDQVRAFTNGTVTPITIVSNSTYCTVYFTFRVDGTLKISIRLARPPPFIIIKADPASFAVIAGAAGRSVINVSGYNGFDGAVNLTSFVYPSNGLSCALAPSIIVGSSGSSTLSCAGDPGSYYVTVRGVGENNTLGSTQVSVNVTAVTVFGLPRTLFYGITGGTATIVGVALLLTVVIRRANRKNRPAPVFY